MSTPVPPLGKYQPLAPLGSGGFAVVYRALDTVLEREVALKVLKPQYLGDPEFVERFFREARTVARLDHPAIIKIFDVDSSDGRAFIAMELAATSLDSVLAKGGPLPWDKALALLRPICEAVDYAHEAGLIHRDLKPANILLSRRGLPLISDFGFARATTQNSATLSVIGGVLGTPGYIAPEIWDAQTAGPPADRYALACIAYEVLTGQTLFKADTPARAVQAHVVEGPHFPAAWPPGVPRSVAEVLAQALRREPERRFKSAIAFWGALNGLSSGAPAEPPAHGRAQPSYETPELPEDDRTPLETQAPGLQLNQAAIQSNPPEIHSDAALETQSPGLQAKQAALQSNPPERHAGAALETQSPGLQAKQAGLQTSASSGDSGAPRRGMFAQLGGPQGCTLAVALALILLAGGYGGLGLLRGANNPGAVPTAGTSGDEPTDAPAATPRPADTPAATSPTPAPPTAAPPTPAPPTAAPAPSALPAIQAAPTPERAWAAEPPEQGRVLERGAGGALFVAGSADKDVSPAFTGEMPSCVQGILVTPDNGRLRQFRVELSNGVETRRADHDHLSGTYAMCGLEPGDWQVIIAEALGAPTSADERAGHAVRFHTSGTPGEIFYISFQARGALPEPAAPLFPPPVASPQDPALYNGRWEGTLTGATPFGPAEGRISFLVSGGQLVYTESAGLPCPWVDPDLRGTIEDGFSFAGLAVRSGVYYELAGAFTSPAEAAGTLTADVGPGMPCLSDGRWTARKVGP